MGWDGKWTSTEKIEIVKKERNAIIAFTEKRSQSPHRSSSPPKNMTAEQMRTAQAEKAAALIEMEEKRIEALKRRQEKELSKIVEREQTMASLQLKIKRAEEEELRKRKAHEKRVAEEKAAEEKKRIQREHEMKKLEQEEQERRRELAKREAEVEEKLKKKRLQQEREMMKEARQRDAERAQKIEEARLKTEALIKAQEELAEQNRLKMLEREERILNQLEEKKRLKREELQNQREKAAKRIAEAIDKHHDIFVKRKEDFDARQAEAEKRARENAILYQEKLKHQADDREKRNRTRLGRLVDAFRNRMDHREEIIERRSERDQVYEKIKQEREQQIAMMKFMTDLQLKDKLDNVERVARMNEFRRLQTLQKIYSEDNKYEEIQEKKLEMLRRHNDECKQSLMRKHEISETMERMRMTNDFTLLDKLFAAKKSRQSRSRMGRTEDADDDPRLNQTI
eukprot:scaffold409_cov167-Ochromonas_danica.AAC.24